MRTQMKRALVFRVLGLSLRTSQKQPFLCGLHEVYSHIMPRPNLYIYLFVYESRGPVTWSSVSHLGCKRAFEYFCSGDRITS